ncbi:hypothetical protein AJ80_07772 [Polytolypa hystricis UAMH7299]|uniref:Vacuolar import and degradation protein-domain-containing protein n=1 Tax=Polytolypa hystricis (strain UAMH7299) TaxID=1447883 RepID=A0A2B7XJ76_POLH7|nr:hypothetical protein AJ80_07772 [Polytolypa hystricis UAMH7299]
MSNPEEDAHNDNISFLRNHPLSGADFPPHQSRRRRQLQYLADNLNMAESSGQRSSSRPAGAMRRIPIVRRQPDSPANPPDSNRPEMSLEPDDNEDEREDMSGGGQEGSSRERDGEEGTDADPVDVFHDLLSGGFLDREIGRSSTGPRGSTRENGTDLATRYRDYYLATALLRSARRSSPAHTLQHEVHGRERDRERERERERSAHDSADWASPPTPTEPETSNSNRLLAAYRRVRRLPRAYEIRHMYLEDPPSGRLEEAIKYLEKVRYSSSFEESMSAALEGGFFESSELLRLDDDFLLDPSSIHRPTDCSWLKPGMVFSGSQHAMHCSNPSMLSHRVGSPLRNTDPVIVNGSESNRISVYTSSGRRYWAHNAVDAGNPSSSRTGNNRYEHWPVKVTILSVDYNTMSLSGTMEAHNIPDKTSGTQGTHIVTYLEGEIIDFRTHSLATKNFNSNTDIDSCYWRELEPFKGLTDDEIVRNLVSKKWLAETLAKGWILMRWKERCFVTPSHSQQGLTISGFYYVTLCREDGSIQGMYYDPGSSPYQRLSLEPEMKGKMVFPAYDFR